MNTFYFCLLYYFTDDISTYIICKPRYPASDSPVRLSVEEGVDKPVPDRGDLEIANDLPEEQLVLHPGGRVVYDLPLLDENDKLDKDLIYVLVKPGKKDPPPLMNNPFTDKANITLIASSGGDPVSVSCGVPSNDRSSYASDYCILSLEPIIQEISSSVVVTITVPVQETRDAVLWQVQLSSLDNSARIKGIFQTEARSLIRQTQTVPNFNTWLTLVSCVGKTGVGKSTVASLLSGNDTMFVAKSSSHGTTTLGADISTIIPAQDYKSALESVLDMSINTPNGNKPLFLIDSEGMKFRGDEVDFVTTGPVAIIANIIVWITEGRMRPPDILEELRHYLKGLDRISLNDGSSSGQDYGQFVVVLNKMQDSDQDYTDEQLCNNLLAWGQSEEDDDTIAEMYSRFKQISCVGLPLVHMEQGEQFGYNVITRYPRFVHGIQSLANKLIKESETAKNVRVGDITYEMNSTNAETIIGLLIDGANQGSIDLTDPCNVMYSLYKEQVIQAIEKLNSELEEATSGRCNHVTTSCSPCVCEYRNNAVTFVTDKLSGLITAGVMEAETLCADKEDVKEDIAALLEEKVFPWHDENVCSQPSDEFQSETVCDISEIQTSFDTYTRLKMSISCEVLHMCGETNVPNLQLAVTTKKIFISNGYQITQEAPPKSANGADCQVESGDGEDGVPGIVGQDISITFSNLLTSSANLISVTLNGGDGGDGGKGGDGKAAVPGINGKNGDNGSQGANGEDGKDGKSFKPDKSNDVRYCHEIIPFGGELYGNVVEYDHGHHACCGFIDHCTTWRAYQHMRYTYDAKSDCNPTEINGTDGTDGEKGGNGTDGTSGTDAVPATKGGNGGKGGPGGNAGNWELLGNSTIKVNLHRIGGKGGKGGLAGLGGLGAEGGKKGNGGSGGKGGNGGRPGQAGYCYTQTRSWDAKKNWHKYGKCGGFLDCDCDSHHQDDPCSELKETDGPEDIYQSGKSGIPGRNGTAGKPGLDGEDGKNASSAPNGLPGQPGEDAENKLTILY